MVRNNYASQLEMLFLDEKRETDEKYISFFIDFNILGLSSFISVISERGSMGDMKKQNIRKTLRK